MPGYVFFFTALLLIAIEPRVQAGDCVLCEKINSEIALLQNEHRATEQLLADNKRVLSVTAANDVSKKVKLTSNIFILSAKVETLANNKLAKSNELGKLGCQTCQKQKL